MEFYYQIPAAYYHASATGSHSFESEETVSNSSRARVGQDAADGCRKLSALFILLLLATNHSMLLFIGFVVMLLLFYIFTLFSISYALMSIVLRKVTDSFFVRMFLGVVLAALLGYLLLVLHESGLTTGYENLLLFIGSLLAGIYLREKQARKSKHR